MEHIVAISQGWRLNGAIKTTERKVAGGDLVHGGSPLMAWSVSNARVEDKGNAISDHEAGSGKAKIDPLMAVFDAVSLMALNPVVCRPFILGNRMKEVSADQLWSVLLGAGYASKAGPNVTLNNALKVSTAFACMKVLSQGCAQVPFKLFQEKRAGELTKIEPARDHSLYDLVTVQPNDWTTSFEFRETLVLHAAMGNAYVFKNVVRGKIIELILLNPARVEKFQRRTGASTTR
jgi:hypothetical protein